MGKIIDTTHVLNGAMQTKARTPKNMVKNNYYLNSLQHKVNKEWNYRWNMVDIEEEQTFGNNDFKSVEAIIQTAYDTSQKTVMSDDWKRLVFKDLKHPVDEGKRYKFSVDFDNPDITEIDKSIWWTINTNKTTPTRGILVRRCDSFFTIPSSDGKNIHYEPVALESDFKYINFYADLTVTVPQAEIYAVMQYNKYTKNIKINHRFLVGAVNLEDKEDNTFFKVKAVRKFQSSATYNLNSIPLVILALERSLVDPQDDLINRIASQSPVYDSDENINNDIDNDINNDESIPEEKIEYYLKVSSEDNMKKILLNTECKFMCYLYNNLNEVIDAPIDVSVDLLSTDNDKYYYEYTRIDNNNFSILNKKAYMKDKLQIICTAELNNNIFSDEILIELGGNT